jgi:aspartate kinase
LGAEEVQIWTDVDGMMTADPRIVESARRIRSLSFDEALELACSGAKKPHHGTLGPASRRDVPIRILNSRHLSPNADGTLIGRRNGAAPGIKSITCKPAVHHLRLRPATQEVWEICKRFRPELLVLFADEDRIELSLDRIDRLDEIRRELERLAEIEIGPGSAVVTLVSEDLASSPELVQRTLEIARSWDPRLILRGVAAPCIRCLADEPEAVVAELHERVFSGPSGEPIA